MREKEVLFSAPWAVLKVIAPFPWEVTHCGDAFLNSENFGRGQGEVGAGGGRP